jgi:hypothetical protein
VAWHSTPNVHHLYALSGKFAETHEADTADSHFESYQAGYPIDLILRFGVRQSTASNRYGELACSSC